MVVVFAYAAGMTDDLRHWLGALLVAAAFLVVALVIPAGESDLQDTLRGGAFALAALVGLIALLKIATGLMSAKERQP